MKRKTEKNKVRIYTVFKDIIKKLWKDPVASNLIAVGIVALLGWLFSLIIKLFS